MSTRRYILAGAPGSGKTAILRALESRGYDIIEEATTDVIAASQSHGDGEPWKQPGFIDEIVSLQRRRQEASASPVSASLANEMDRIIGERIYDPRVLFVRPIGFVEPSAARRITFEDSLEFERVHEAAYRAHGFEVVDIPRTALAGLRHRDSSRSRAHHRRGHSHAAACGWAVGAPTML